jgi:hypothetical protein
MTQEQKQQFEYWLTNNMYINASTATLIVKHVEHYFLPESLSPAATVRGAEPDPFIEKHLNIIFEKMKEAQIQLHIKPMFDSLSALSIKHFLETGTVNGGFHQALHSMMNGLRGWSTRTHPVPQSGYTLAQVSDAWDECYKYKGWVTDAELEEKKKLFLQSIKEIK